MPSTPIPKEIINGTVIGPVVTPPESNATDKKSPGTKNTKIKITVYDFGGNMLAKKRPK